ncbi:hypothetical protein GQ457_08G033670 [Hibiscus cannabinus]
MLLDSKERKTGSKTSDCMFVGYAEHSVAYRFLVLRSDILEKNTIVETKNAEFFEHVFPLKTDILLHVPTIQTARLVAKGFTQKQNIDYFDTFTPFIRISSIRILIALTPIHTLFIHQMDDKTTFLNDDLEKEIYMEQPEGCIVSSHESKVCKLLKYLYGLKQAPKQWHENFDQVLMSDDFTSVDVDKCVYTKLVIGNCVIICLYVDDMLIFSNCYKLLHETKRYLASNFDMIDMGETNLILKVKIIRKGDSIILSQEHYVEKLLKKFGYFDTKPLNTPYDANTQLKKNTSESIGQSKYAQIIGSLMHLIRDRVRIEHWQGPNY